MRDLNVSCLSYCICNRSKAIMKMSDGKIYLAYSEFEYYNKEGSVFIKFENDFGYLYYSDGIDICDHYLFVYLDASYRDGEIYNSMIRNESGFVMIDLNSENVASDFERKINVIRKPVEEQVNEILKTNK